MVGIVTQLVTLEKATAAMAASADPELNDIAAIISDPANNPYANLGAIGPDLMDFMPADFVGGGLGASSGYASFWRQIFGIASGTATTAGLFPTLTTLTGFLDRLEQIAADEDLDALMDLQESGDFDVLEAALADLSAIVDNLPTLVGPILTAIEVSTKPFVTVDAGATPPPPIVWSARDFLSWKHTGEFAHQLVERAKASGDGRFMAYAYGWTITYVTKTVGDGFTSSIVNGPYRLHWWRSRWINMFVDAWVWGAYTHPGGVPAMGGAGGDEPTPPYEDWPDLCAANLQDRLSLPGIDAQAILDAMKDGVALPPVLPGDFEEFWFETFAAVYGTAEDLPSFVQGQLNNAYQLTWLMLWFQTSGRVLGCLPVPPVAPSDPDCGENPPWVDPATAPPGETGTGSLPPSPSVEQDVDEGKVICGVILALLGLGALFVGGWVAGAAAIAGGVALIIDGVVEINWDDFRCQLHWYRLYMYNALKALHEASVLIGISHPYSRELANDSAALSLVGFSFTFDSGRHLVRSRVKDHGIYPAAAWNPVILTANWTETPSGLEAPSNIPCHHSVYPDWWIDDAANPLANGRVFEGAQWPQKMMGAASSTPADFGNIIDNALDVLKNISDPPPDWNLDADRGIAHLTWEFDGPYADPVNIRQES